MKYQEPTTLVTGLEESITCIRCHGYGVVPDALSTDGNVVDCGLCSQPTGYTENSFEYKQHELYTRNDDNYLEIL